MWQSQKRFSSNIALKGEFIAHPCDIAIFPAEGKTGPIKCLVASTDIDASMFTFCNIDFHADLVII